VYPVSANVWTRWSHCIAAKRARQRLHQVGELARAAGDDFLVYGLGFHAPLPCVLKGCDLRGGFFAALFLEKDVVVGVGIEGWVKVNQVDTGVRDVVAKNFKVIAKIKPILSIHLRKAYHKLGG